MQDVGSYTISQLKNAYDEYLKIDLATPSHKSIIYDNGWYIATGRSFASPRPHRHFKFDEFVEYGMVNAILFTNFIKS